MPEALAPLEPAAPWFARVSTSALMVAASFLFASMGVCVKLASAHYAPGELVLYRSAIGMTMMAGLVAWQGGRLATPIPAMHFWRSLSGVISLCLWFYSLAALPLATAMTLNYTSSVWMALFLMGGASMLGGARIDGRLVATVLIGFAGVAMILRPTIDEQQLWHGLAGLLSGMIAAIAYLQVTALGRAGEPELRIVFYFSFGGVVAGAMITVWTGFSAHSLRGVALLLGIGVLATVAQMMMTRAYASGSPLVNGSLQYLGIAFSFGYGVLLFADCITWLALAGIVLIVVAGLFATLLRSRVALPDIARSPPETA
ncbi:MAG: DMT family transporter [Burkholderiaceae bacterium]